MAILTHRSRSDAGTLLDIRELINSLSRGLAGLALPAVVVAVAFVIAPRVNSLPPSLAGLRSWGPTLLILMAATLALAFNRGRVLFAVLSLGTGFAAYTLMSIAGLSGLSARAVFGAICIFVPLNLVALCVLRERGIFNLFGVRRIGAIVLQALFVGWVIKAQRTDVTDFAYHTLAQIPALADSPIPQLGLAIIIVGIVAAVTAAVMRHSAIDGGFAGAIAGVAVACHSVGAPNAFPVFFGAAALILGIAVLHDTFRLAFRDELTGLGSRRALNERLMALGGQYTLAMVDVDHFKAFNDRHGHAVGDQVLRMVATRLGQAGAGVRAYRYGGEEFTLILSGKGVGEAWSTLEAVREDIASYELAIRAPNRPACDEPGAAQRQGKPPANHVSVTVSIGIAERSGRAMRPHEVLGAADKALYRAKDKGRNRVSA